MPCPEKKRRYCPFNDNLFLNVLEYYIRSVRLPSIFKEGLNLMNPIASKLELSDISGLFDSHDFIDYIAIHLKSGRILLSRDNCEEMKRARSKWWRLFSPDWYKWRGDPEVEPKKYGVD